MFVGGNRLFILTLVLVVSLVFVIQNQQPLALVFFGFEIPFQLPLSLWILLFIAAGAVSSFCMQLLNFSPKRTSSRTVYTPSDREPFSPQPTPRNNSPTPDRSPRSTESRETTSENRGSSTHTSPTAAGSNTEKPPEAIEDDKLDKEQNDRRAIENENANEEREWNIEEPPAQTTINKPFDRPLKEDKSAPSKVFEAPQQPKSASRSGSIYSYTYKKPGDTSVGKSENVYDVKYRVIRPPYRDLPHEPIEDEDEDEDWIK